MSDDFNKPASVQYGDWTGTVAADEVDGVDLEKFLGVDTKRWRLLLVDLIVYGGRQHVEGYGVPANMTYDDLAQRVAAGEPLVLDLVGEVEFDPQHADTNPPAPLSFPVVSAGEFVGHGFKRLHIRFVSRNIPPGAVLSRAEADE